MFKRGNLPNKLWDHQRDAIEFIIGRLNAKSETNTCVVRMPTGTGKTGVIAWVSMMSHEGKTLILTPWTNLRDQMIKDLTEGFWKNSGIPAPKLSVRSLLPSSADKILADPAIKVIVSSLAALTDLRRDHPDSYEAIKNLIDLVIVDEGHYEPAVEWGKSVKKLEKPTVLMTATPYRNDLKLFHISQPEKSVWQFHHDKAQNTGVIRALEFHSLGSSTNLDELIKNFITFWKKSVKNETLASDTPRAIICCVDSIAIKAVVNQLQAEGISALGVHDRFRNDPKIGFYKDVPPINTKADIWVHQHKLVEGLDDYRFCCVALFCSIHNDRKLVQQIGRVLRKHTTDRKDKNAILLSPDEFDAENSWQCYLEFEKNAKLVTVSHYRNVVNEIIKLQPEAEYFGGRFRKRFDPFTLDHDSKITISPSVLVRSINDNFSFEDYVSDCTDTLMMDDAIILGQKEFSPCVKAKDYALWVYVSVRNSRLLSQDSMYEIRLEAHCAVISDSYLLISDTTGIYPTEFIEEWTSGITPSDLSSLLDNTFRLTNLSVTSAIPFDNVVRAAEIRSPNIAKIPASLTDRVQICRSARGASTNNGRRYVGIKKGRVRQELSTKQLQKHSLFTFIKWCQGVTKVLKNKSSGCDVFGRYMQTCPPPKNLIAKTICIDLVRRGADFLGPNDVLVQAMFSSAELKPIGKNTNTYKFTLKFEMIDKPNTNYKEEVLVEYQLQKKRFWFKSGGEKQIRVAVEDEKYPKGRSLHDYLNLNQDLVLIGLDGGDTVYQGRDFYMISYSTAEKSLLDRIITLTNAGKCKTEKGTAEQLKVAKGGNGKGNAKQNTFPTGSLFQAIVSEKDVVPFNADLIICDDLNSECCDFLVADTKGRKLALLHAKTGEGANISASSFHEVVAQAIKNLAYLSPNAETPKGAPSWKKGMLWNKTAIERIIKAPQNSPEGENLWESLRSNIIQSVDGELHVVLVTTGCCNRMRLQEAIDDKKKRTHETAQLFHLLEGLNGYSRQLGVRLTVVDIPFDNSLVGAAKEKKKSSARAPSKTRSTPTSMTPPKKQKSKST